MRQIVKFTAKVLIVFLGSLALSACGDILDPDKDGALGKAGEVISRVADNPEIRVIAEEEQNLRMNPECGLADDEFLDSILEIVARFNELAKSDNEFATNLILAGHPDHENGISVRVCADSQIAAYAYLETVVIHDGLLHALKDSAGSDENLFRSAVAFVIYHELLHTQMGHAAMSTDNTAIELEADFFALSAMKDVGYDTAGAQLVFSVLMKINPNGSPTHPAATRRAKALEVGAG